MSALDKKYGMCNNYFCVYKSINKLKTYEEAEQHFIDRVKKNQHIKNEFQRIYYELMEKDGDMRNFGKFLFAKGIRKNEFSVWGMFSQKFVIGSNKVLANRWVKNALEIIEAYKEYMERENE